MFSRQNFNFFFDQTLDFVLGKIQAASHCRIVIAQLEDENHCREVCITGPADGIETAKQMMQEIMDADEG